MKRVMSFLLTLCMILGTVNVYSVMAEESNREDIEYLATAIYQRLDDYDGNEFLEKGNLAYKAGRYDEALVLFRNHFIEKLRGVEQAYYPGINFKSTSYPLLNDVVIGEATVEEYQELYPAHGVDDCLGAFGSPYIERKIDWLGGLGKPGGTMYMGKGQEAFLNWIAALPISYYKKAENGVGARVYIDKFWQVLSDFSVNQKKDTDAYMLDTPDVLDRERDSRFTVWNWHCYNERFAFVTNAMTQFAKLLPAEGETTIPDIGHGITDWDNIVPAFPKANPDYYYLFDEVALAQWVVQTFEDDVPHAYNGTIADYAANQKDSTKRRLVQMIAMFSEFDLGAKYEARAIETTKEVWISSYQDGSMLEASFNYNDDTYSGLKGLATYCTQMGITGDWIDEYAYACKIYEYFKEGYTGQGLLLPKVGNGGQGSEKVERIWEDDDALERYKASKNYTLDENPPPYTSIAFPFGGYVMLRTGWSIRDDISLGFYNSERFGSGHTSPILNSVWLSAYGRPLIVSGGGNIYAASYLAEEEQENYKKWNEYFGESASRKGSTVLVNDSNQAVSSAEFPERKDAREATPVKARFGTSDYFDYAEGIFGIGYKGSLGNIKDVDHVRSNIQIREADLWIITDTMKNEGDKTNTYSQIWKFPPKSDKYPDNKHEGFTNEQVVVDEAGTSIKTQDPGSVNLFMTQISNESLSYQKYFGSRGENGNEIYRGWEKDGISGNVVPSADVYVRWEDNDENKETQVITVAMPSRTDATPYKSLTKKNDSENGITGFELVTKDDIVVTYYSSSTPKDFTVDGIKAKAKNLVVTKNGDEIRGVVMDCETISYNDKPMEKLNESFEFVVEEGRIKDVNEINIKTSFGWVEVDEGHYPVYDCYTMSEATQISKDIDEAYQALKVLRYKNNKYVLDKISADTDDFVKNISDFDKVTVSTTKSGISDTIKNYLDKVYDICNYYQKADFNEKTVALLNKFKENVGKVELLQESDNTLVDGINDKIAEIAEKIGSEDYEGENEQKPSRDEGIDIGVIPGGNKDEVTPPIIGTKGFVDIEKSWAKAEILELYNKGLVKGMTDTTFGPDLSMTRAEFVTLLLRIVGIEERAYNNSFIDVKADAWYANAVGTAFEEGLADGKGDGFAPNDKITRQEAAKMIIVASKITTEGEETQFIDNDAISDWAKAHVKAAQVSGLISGYPDGSFAPLKNITRAESVVIFKRLLTLLENINNL